MPASKWSERLTGAMLRVALLAFSFSLMFGLCELVLRFVYRNSEPYVLARIVEYDALLGWRLVPGSYEFFNPAAFTHASITINELGLRGVPVALRAQSPGRRITVLGDSFVFSEGLSDGALFTAKLEQRLGSSCEVVNAGVPGYGTGQEALHLASLRERGFEIGRQVVIVFFTNDISDNAGQSYGSLDLDPRKPIFEVRDGELIHTRPPPWPAIPKDAIAADIARKSLFAAFLRQRVELLASGNPWLVTLLARFDARVPLPRPPGVIHGWYAEGWEARWERTRQILDYLAMQVASAGSEPVIAFMPSPFQAEPVFEAVMRSYREQPLYAAFLADIDRPQRMLESFCAARPYRCIDLTPALRALRDQPAFFLQEGHLNELGSALVAAALHAALGDRC
jgi:hypothetical protein